MLNAEVDPSNWHWEKGWGEALIKWVYVNECKELRLERVYVTTPGRSGLPPVCPFVLTAW